MSIWFSSDHHFGHRNIIKFCKRPFKDVQEMDEIMIQKWNAVVKPDDLVYYIGDFQISDDPDKYLPRLNGRKILIKGNHDYEHPAVIESDHWEETHDILVRSINNCKITLCHYAMRVWPSAHKGSLMLYGHSHNRLIGSSQSLDVCADGWDYTPISMKQIQKRLKIFKEYSDPSYRDHR